MSPKVRSHDDDQERLGKAQERIQSMFSEQRKKEQDRRKEQCTPQRHRPSSQTNATTPRGVEERKKLAQLWHERLGEPDRATMKALVHKKSQGCDLDLEDVDLLSWGNLPAMTVSSCSESSDGSDDKSAFQVVSKRTAGTEDFSAHDEDDDRTDFERSFTVASPMSSNSPRRTATALRRSASRRSICSTPLRRTGFAGDQQHDLSFSSFSSHGALEKIDADESFTSIKKSSTPKTKKKSRPSLSKALEAQKGASSSEDERESKERSKASSKKSSRSSSTRRRRDSSLGRHSIAGTSAASATLADTKKHRKSSKKKLHKDSETASLTSRSKTSSKDPFGVPPSRGPQGYVNPELQQKLKLYKKYRKSTSSLCSANSSTCGESVSHRSEDLEHIFPNFVVHGS